MLVYNLKYDLQGLLGKCFGKKADEKLLRWGDNEKPSCVLPRAGSGGGKKDREIVMHVSVTAKLYEWQAQCSQLLGLA